MSYISPFTPQLQSFIINTNASANTTQSTPVTPAALGNAANIIQPMQLRLFNAGTAVIWASFTAASASAVIPTPGTTTVGTPQATTWLWPNIEITLGLQPAWQPLNGVPTFYINTICSAASQPLYVTLGEGV